MSKGDFSAQMNEILALYGTEIVAVVDGEVTTIADEAVNQLKATSPEHKGKYAKNWRSEKSKDGLYKSSATIYNKKHYRLTHVLERGHATRDGGRTKAQPHIKPVEEMIKKTLPVRIQKKIKGGS